MGLQCATQSLPCSMQVAPDSEYSCFNSVVWRNRARDCVEEGPLGPHYKVGLTAVPRRLSELTTTLLSKPLSNTPFQHVY
jgi:hypothetical protein